MEERLHRGVIGVTIVGVLISSYATMEELVVALQEGRSAFLC
jgi:hypothetical protein